MKPIQLFIYCLLISGSTLAQTDSLPPSWIFGAVKGYALIDGEVKAGSGFGFGFFAEKPFSRVLGANLYIGLGDMRGLDQTPSTNWVNHPVWNGTRINTIDYANANADFIYANFQTSYQEASLQAVFTFSQLPFFRNDGPLDGMLVAGIGGLRYQTRIDAAQGNGTIYDFTLLEGLNSTTDAETFANLNSILDGDYESPAMADATIIPTFLVGAGIQWRLNDRLAFRLSHRVSFTNTDLLDSYQWDAANQVEGRNDLQHFTTIALCYALPRKKKTPEPVTVVPPINIREIPQPKPVDTVAIVLTDTAKNILRRAFENTEFETNKAQIRPASYEVLNELANLLAENPTWKLRITGHTDNVGKPEANMRLSKRRAEAVRDYLTDQGIHSHRLVVSWHGEEIPIADNATEEGRQKNRRVEFEIAGN